jgi:hypothetical protein
MVHPENQGLVGKYCSLSLSVLHYLVWERIEYGMKWKCSIYIALYLAGVNSFSERIFSLSCVCQKPNVLIFIIIVTLLDLLMNFRQVLIALIADTHLTCAHLLITYTSHLCTFTQHTHTQCTVMCRYKTVTFDISIWHK